MFSYFIMLCLLTISLSFVFNVFLLFLTLPVNSFTVLLSFSLSVSYSVLLCLFTISFFILSFLQRFLAPSHAACHLCHRVMVCGHRLAREVLEVVAGSLVELLVCLWSWVVPVAKLIMSTLCCTDIPFNVKVWRGWWWQEVFKFVYLSNLRDFGP